MTNKLFEFTFRRPTLISLVKKMVAIVFMYGSMNGDGGWWVRDQKRWLKLVPPPEPERDPSASPLLSWGVSIGRAPRYGASLTITLPVGPQYSHLAEVYHLLTGTGSLRGKAENGGPGDFPRLAVYTHDSSGQTKDPAVMEPAERYGMTPDLAMSDTPYRVDKNWYGDPPEQANPWLIVGVVVDSWKSWYYDLSDGTPAGFYDLRPGCQNEEDDPNLGIQYPPPPMRQSQKAPGSADVGCFRWVVNPGWDESDPYSQRYIVYSYTFYVDEESAPDGCPLAMGSTWDDITETEMTVEKDKHYPQSVVFDALGATWHEDGKTLAWQLRKGFQGSSAFRYRYPCTFTTVRKGVDSTQDAGRIYQVETKSWGAQGVRALLNGTIIYDDAPNGVSAITRIQEGVFPSWGGQLDIPAALRTNTLRRLTFGANRRGRIYPVSYGRPDGSFYVLATDENWDEPPTGVHHLARPSGSNLLLPGIEALGPSAWESTIREINGRVWAYLHPIYYG